MNFNIHQIVDKKNIKNFEIVLWKKRRVPSNLKTKYFLDSLITRKSLKTG